MDQPQSLEITDSDQAYEADTDVPRVVRTILADRFCRTLEEIIPQTRLLDLGANSLDMIEIYIALEERLRLPFPQVTGPDEIDVATVQDLTDLVTARLARTLPV